MYLSSPTTIYEAGTGSSAGEVGTQWYFGEGVASATFDTFLLFYNPNAVTAEVQVRYMRRFGAPVTATYTIAAGNRLSVWTDLIAGLDQQEFGMVVTSMNDVPVAVERAVWGGGAPFIDGHASQGLSTPSLRWGLNGGEADNAAGADTYVLIVNPTIDNAIGADHAGVRGRHLEHAADGAGAGTAPGERQRRQPDPGVERPALLDPRREHRRRAGPDRRRAIDLHEPGLALAGRIERSGHAPAVVSATPSVPLLPRSHMVRIRRIESGPVALGQPGRHASARSAAGAVRLRAVGRRREETVVRRDVARPRADRAAGRAAARGDARCLDGAADGEDVEHSVLVRLTHQLWRQRGRTDEPIGNVAAYVARTASNACYEQLRGRRPQRARLHARLRYVFRHHATLALWERPDGGWACGDRAWRDREGVLGWPAVAEWRGTHRRARGCGEPGSEAARLVRLAEEIVRTLGAPARLEDVVTLAADALGIVDTPVEPAVTQSGEMITPFAPGGIAADGSARRRGARPAAVPRVRLERDRRSARPPARRAAAQPRGAGEPGHAVAHAGDRDRVMAADCRGARDGR